MYHKMTSRLIKICSAIILVCLSCSQTNKNNIDQQANTNLVNRLSIGQAITMNDLEIPNGSDFFAKYNGKLYSGMVFSTKSFNEKSVAFEIIKDGVDIVAFEIYYPNGQKAYECYGSLSYDGNYFAPDGTLIDFYEFANNYFDVWCRHEGFLPVTLICPACLLDQLEFEKEPETFQPDSTSRRKLIRKHGGIDNI